MNARTRTWTRPQPGALAVGFTLIELLVVMAIIAILTGLLLPALAGAKKRCNQVNEINAGRQLILAWQLYADDNRDQVLLGYHSEAVASDDRGNAGKTPVISSPNLRPLLWEGPSSRDPRDEPSLFFAHSIIFIPKSRLRKGFGGNLTLSNYSLLTRCPEFY